MGLSTIRWKRYLKTPRVGLKGLSTHRDSHLSIWKTGLLWEINERGCSQSYCVSRLTVVKGPSLQEKMLFTLCQIITNINMLPEQNWTEITHHDHDMHLGSWSQLGDVWKEEDLWLDNRIMPLHYDVMKSFLWLAELHSWLGNSWLCPGLEKSGPEICTYPA